MSLNWLDDYKQRLALMTDRELDEEREYFADPNHEWPGTPQSHAERKAAIEREILLRVTHCRLRP